jgi:hypothetical protein
MALTKRVPLEAPSTGDPTPVLGACPDLRMKSVLANRIPRRTIRSSQRPNQPPELARLRTQRALA